MERKVVFITSQAVYAKQMKKKGGEGGGGEQMLSYGFAT